MRHAIIGDEWEVRVASQIISGCERASSSVHNLLNDSDIHSVWVAKNPILGHHADLLDGMAKIVGMCDIVVRQPTGATSLLVGFSVASRALTPLVRPMFTPSSRIVIIGGGYMAASAVTSAAELGARQIVVVADPTGGPGTPLAVAHKIGIECETLRPEEMRFAKTDIVIHTEAATDERIPRDSSVHSDIFLYETHHAREQYCTFWACYLREMILVASGKDTPINTLTEAVDNFLR
ncbi:Rossmann-fold NAD(P)-binding domain-containing protein [Arcanobacterium haemolyticum]|uniref:Uncharacterized protein n=1 Tax=Arcanobacterium haemolyticum (strain ATCC 9345 / DSM 20595 / CCM 5947 / CCUG 17215 / LMG 16163 / NBRC 15585 / NCTC 8452 / 11018) TaxID=644284 RepID=D7BNS2_ARCHD|nr:hypothetical protein [Arcanobacterium haemolyticum]ADH92571.1 hypothetical protein Arch_0845 [Arcanobacterium haemolyticum DSM 20595]SQH28695.1 Uncharacterised protein [Arcanobacterium haemolyticum]